MLVDKVTNWLEYFNSISNDFPDSNLKPSSILKSSSSSFIREEKLNNLTSENGDHIIFFMNHVNKIQAIHSIANLGGSTRFPVDFIVGLSGFKNEKATPISIDADELFSSFEVEVPTFNRVKTVNSEQDLFALSAPTTNASVLKISPFIELPPFLWDLFSNLNSKSAEEAFILSLKTIEEFKNNISDSDKAEAEDTVEVSKNLLLFLWAAASDLVPKVHINLEQDNERVERWSNMRHRACLDVATVNDSQSVSTSITSSEELERLQATIDDLRNSQRSMTSNLMDEKKGFEKLHIASRQLILNASSPDGEMMAGSPSHHCKEFFACKTASLAKATFIRSMKRDFNCHVNPPNGVTTNIFNGQFIWEFPNSPSNFSVFSFPKRTIFTKNPTSDCTILQMKELSGKGLSNDDVEAALKQGILVAETLEDLNFCIMHFIGASRYFFSPNSMLAKNLLEIHEHIDSHRADYESLLEEDDEFISKFLYIIDQKVMKFLEECEEKEERCFVNDNLISFSAILDQVSTRQFFATLPSSIRKVINKDTSFDDKLSSGPRIKKQKVDKSMDPKKESNEGKIEDWILDIETFNKKVRGNKNLNNRPKFKGTPICHRFHSKGFCFDNCTHKDSHVPSSELPAEQKNEYSTFLSKILNKNN